MGLTRRWGCDTISYVVASEALSFLSGGAILENDTENVQTVQETVRFERVKRLDEMLKGTGFGELVMESREFKIED